MSHLDPASATAAALSASNPFSTRYVRPGAVEYHFPRDDNALAMIERLRANTWRGEIVGPHGSGKSTLLAALLPLLASAGRQVVHLSLHEGDRRLPVSSAAQREWNEQTLVVVDGYEQLGWWARKRLDFAGRRRGAGLLVTAHASVGLPALVVLSPNLGVLQTIVARLLPPACTWITPEDVEQCFARQEGNARETLFALYDLFESRRNYFLQAAHAGKCDCQ